MPSDTPSSAADQRKKYDLLLRLVEHITPAELSRLTGVPRRRFYDATADAKRRKMTTATYLFDQYSDHLLAAAEEHARKIVAISTHMREMGVELPRARRRKKPNGGS